MTISEIAKLAEVSSAAVSRYLNGGSLSEEKRNRIKAVIEETGYVPSEYARTLRTKKTYHVGVIVPNIKSSTTARICRIYLADMAMARVRAGRAALRRLTPSEITGKTGK